MKSRFFKLMLVLALFALPLTGFAQKKVYTRSFRIQDFKIKTTKVVLDGSPALVRALREDITTFWSVSPYEFCTPAEYEQQKADPSFYFLRPRTRKGIVYLTLTKGGKDGEQDALKAPMTLVEAPVAGESSEASLIYMPAFVSIIQDYMEAAMESEAKAYLGLSAASRIRPRNVKVCKDPSEAEKFFRSADGSAAVQVVITPDGTPAGKPCHRYIFNASTYELYAFR